MGIYDKRILLSKDEYDFILKYMFEYDEFCRQINYYFDTDNLGYSNLGIICHITENGDKYTATIKEYKKYGKSFETIGVAKNSYDISLFEGMNVEYQGMLITERCINRQFKGISIMLDKNTYLDCVDYEIKVEYDMQYYSDAIQIFKCISYALFCNTNEVSTRHTIDRFVNMPSKSKSQRFFEHLERIKVYDEKEV